MYSTGPPVSHLPKIKIGQNFGEQLGEDNEVAGNFLLKLEPRANKLKANNMKGGDC